MAGRAKLAPAVAGGMAITCQGDESCPSTRAGADLTKFQFLQWSRARQGRAGQGRVAGIPASMCCSSRTPFGETVRSLSSVECRRARNQSVVATVTTRHTARFSADRHTETHRTGAVVGARWRQRRAATRPSAARRAMGAAARPFLSAPSRSTGAVSTTGACF